MKIQKHNGRGYIHYQYFIVAIISAYISFGYAVTRSRQQAVESRSHIFNNNDTNFLYYTTTDVTKKNKRRNDKKERSTFHNKNIPFKGRDSPPSKVFFAVAGSMKKTTESDQDGILARETRFLEPVGLWKDPLTQDIYITDSGSHRVKKLSKDSTITTFAGEFISLTITI